MTIQVAVVNNTLKNVSWQLVERADVVRFLGIRKILRLDGQKNSAMIEVLVTIHPANLRV